MSMDITLAPTMIDSAGLVLSPMLAWQSAGVSMALEAQQLQWRLMLGWQDSVSAMQRDWWDGWIAHFGGGVPLDA